MGQLTAFPAIAAMVLVSGCAETLTGYPASSGPEVGGSAGYYGTPGYAAPGGYYAPQPSYATPYGYQPVAVAPDAYQPGWGRQREDRREHEETSQNGSRPPIEQSHQGDRQAPRTGTVAPNAQRPAPAVRSPTPSAGQNKNPVDQLGFRPNR